MMMNIARDHNHDNDHDNDDDDDDDGVDDGEGASPPPILGGGDEMTITAIMSLIPSCGIHG